MSHEEAALQRLQDSAVWAGTTSEFRILAAIQAQVHATLALLEEVRASNVKPAYSNWKGRPTDVTR